MTPPVKFTALELEALELDPDRMAPILAGVAIGVYFAYLMFESFQRPAPVIILRESLDPSKEVFAPDPLRPPPATRVPSIEQLPSGETTDLGDLRT